MDLGPDTTMFSGREGAHTISRTTCDECGMVLSETHFGCCGHGSNGWGGVTCPCLARWLEKKSREETA